MGNKLNLLRITLTSFLAYFIMAAIITPLGVVSQPMADYFSVSVTASTAIFSSLTSGIFVGSIVAIFIFDYLSIKTVVLGAALLILGSVLAIYALDNFFALSFCLFFAGLGCGAALSTAAVVISTVYDQGLRPSMLLLTDSFYSGAGSISTFLAVYLIAQNWHWWSIYLLAIAALLVLILMAVFSDYPVENESSAQAETQIENQTDGFRQWPASVYICGISLLAYLLGLVTIYSWVPNYAQSVLALEQAEAGNLVARLFSGMFIGQLVMFLLVLRLPVKPLIALCLVLAILMTINLWLGKEHIFSLDIPIASSMFVLGLVGGGILKVLISYGTTLTQKPSPKMVSYLLFNTALGTAIAPALSAWVVETSGMVAVMVFATACYVASLLFLLIAFGSQSSMTSASKATI